MSFGHLGPTIRHCCTIICGNAVKDKYYADKPEKIDDLKNNIREDIGQIQLHTIDNVLKNQMDRLGYCMACQGSHLYEIIFHYKTEGLYFQNKKTEI